MFSRSLNHNKLWLIVGWIVMGSFGTLSADEFRWKFAPEDRFAVVLTQASETQSVCETIKRISGNEIRLEIDWKVRSVENDLAVIEQTIQRVQIRLSTPTVDGSNVVEIDTAANDETRPKKGVEQKVFKDLSTLVGMTATLSMNTRGEIFRVIVAEEDLQKLRQAGSNTPLLNLMTADGMSELFRSSCFVFPEETLPTGSEWTNRRTTNGPFGELITRELYRFEGEIDRDGRNRQQFTLATTAEKLPTIPPDANPVDPPPELREISSNGTFWFDSGSGLFTESTTTSILKSRKSFRDLLIHTTITSSSTMTMERR
jgi:hypothetical protein